MAQTLNILYRQVIVSKMILIYDSGCGIFYEAMNTSLTRLPTMPLMLVIIILRHRKDDAFILEDGWIKLGTKKRVRARCLSWSMAESFHAILPLRRGRKDGREGIEMRKGISMNMEMAVGTTEGYEYSNCKNEKSTDPVTSSLGQDCIMVSVVRCLGT